MVYEIYNAIVFVRNFPPPIFCQSRNTLFYVCNIKMRTKFIVRNTVTINTFSCIAETTVLNQSESLPLWFSWRGKSPTSHLRWIAGRTNIIFCYFSNFGHGFRGPFFMLFLKAPTFCRKKFWNNFCSIALLFVWAQKVCLRFLKSYFKLEILIFLPFMVSFLADMFN